MNVARILYPVQVLGPGKRVGIWLCGCPHRCEGCSNPELWEFQECYNASVETILDLINGISEQVSIDGFTITGGEPFYQYDELLLLLKGLSKISKDTLVYSGYALEDLKEKDLSNIAVLIDGPYIKERNNGAVIRGSDNQEIHILKEEFRELYREYLSNTHNQVQNFTTSDGVVSVGIHRPNFRDELHMFIEKH